MEKTDVCTGWPDGKRMGLGWHLVALKKSPDQGEEERSQMIGWDPQNGSGDSFLSAEIDNKKVSRWTGFVAGRRTKASIPGRRRQKNISDTRDPNSSSQY